MASIRDGLCQRGPAEKGRHFSTKSASSMTTKSGEKGAKMRIISGASTLLPLSRRLGARKESGGKSKKRGQPAYTMRAPISTACHKDRKKEDPLEQAPKTSYFGGLHPRDGESGMNTFHVQPACWERGTKAVREVAKGRRGEYEWGRASWLAVRGGPRSARSPQRWGGVGGDLLHCTGGTRQDSSEGALIAKGSR